MTIQIIIFLVTTFLFCLWLFNTEQPVEEITNESLKIQKKVLQIKKLELQISKIK